MARSSGCERWVYSGSDTDNGGARAGISKHFGGLIQHGRACPLPPQMAAEEIYREEGPAMLVRKRHTVPLTLRKRGLLSTF